MTTLLSRLREATADTHLALERRLALGSADLDAPTYRAIVAGFYGFFAPWESAVAGFPWPDLQAVFADRWRLSRLRDDLRHLGVADPDRLPVCGALPDLADRGRVLGSCYVLEGSTLGGQVVGRRVEQSLGMAGGAGYSFFLGHGPAATGARWKQFVAWMTEQADAAGRAEADSDAGEGGTPRSAFADAAVAGAVGTFAALDAWFAERLGQPQNGGHASP